MRTCFVPFCDIKNRNKPNRTRFLVPREKAVFAQWVQALPNVRTLRCTDKVCYLHFMPDDIIYTFDHCINGIIYKIKRDRPRLKPGAVPSLKMNTKEELLSCQVKSRLCSNSKNLKKNNDTTLSDDVYDVIMEEEHQENNEANYIVGDEVENEEVDNYAIIVNLEEDAQYISNHELTITAEPDNQIGDLIVEESNYACGEATDIANDTDDEQLLATKRINLFNILYDNVFEILLPNTQWGIHRCPNRNLICFSYMDISRMQIAKVFCIKSDGSVQLLIYGDVVKTWQLLLDIDDVDSLSIILNGVDSWRLCPGKDSNINCDIIVEDHEMWNEDHFCIGVNNDEIFICKRCTQIKQV